MKISNVKYTDLFFNYGKEEIEKIVFLDQNPLYGEKCDIAILFGGISMIPYRMDEALKIYTSGYVDKLLVTGGIGFFNTDRKMPEAYKMQSYLIENGVALRDILVEDQSRNTLENIKYSLALLKERYQLEKLKIACVTSDFHLKRCQGMLEYATENKNMIIGYGARDGKTDIDSWNQNDYGRKMIKKEAISLCFYARQKKITDYELNI